MIPTTWAQWWAWMQMALGVLLAWTITPSVWLIAGPFRTLALISTCAAQESSYNCSASGDSGTSLGILQFQLSTWQAVGMDADNRNSCFWSGYAAVRYIRAGLWSSWRTWLIAVPVYGVIAIRHYWTHGTVAGASFDVFSTEANVLGASIFWTVVLRPFGLLAALLAYRRMRP